MHVACDYSIQAAHVNIFVESAVGSKDEDEVYNMPNFSIHRNDYDPQNSTQEQSMVQFCISEIMLSVCVLH